jgi:hypothetical protein
MTSLPFRLLVLAPLGACLLGCGGGGGGGTSPVIPPPPTSQGVTVSGRVVDAGAEEKGVPNAEVTIRPVSKSPALSRDDAKRAVTNTEGYYAVEDVQPGKATLTIQLPDGSYQALEMLIDVPGDRPTASVYVKLIPRDVPPPTTVTLSPKNPSVQAGSTLQFTAQVSPASGMTPFFSVQGDVGTINAQGLFTATKPGAATVQANVGNVSEGTTVTVTPAPPTTGAITGLVIDNDSLPLAGVTVRTDGRETTTSADGSYTLSQLSAGSYTLTATTVGFATASKAVSVVAGQVKTVDWVLQLAPGAVSGTVKDLASGDGIPGATITVSGKTAQTNAAGGFTVTAVPVGGQTLTIAKTGFDTKAQQLTVPSGATLNMGTVYLQPAGTSAPGVPVL